MNPLMQVDAAPRSEIDGQVLRRGLFPAANVSLLGLPGGGAPVTVGGGKSVANVVFSAGGAVILPTTSKLDAADVGQMAAGRYFDGMRTRSNGGGGVSPAPSVSTASRSSFVGSEPDSSAANGPGLKQRLSFVGNNGSGSAGGGGGGGGITGLVKMPSLMTDGVEGSTARDSEHSMSLVGQPPSSATGGGGALISLAGSLQMKV